MRILICSLFLISFNSWGKWATEADLSFSLIDHKDAMVVAKDGSYTVTNEDQYEVLNDAGVEKFKIFNLPYDGSKRKINITKAYVLNGNKKFYVDDSSIVYKDSSGGQSGLTSIKVVRIMFPKVKPGSKIFLNFKAESIKSRYPQFFSMDYTFGNTVFEKKSVSHVISEVPLYWNKTDPEKALEFKEWKEKGKFHYQVRLTKPILKIMMNELGSILPKQNLTMVSISQLKNWKEFNDHLYQTYEKTVPKIFPKVLNRLLTKVKNKKNIPEQIEEASRQIIKNFGYAGDWRNYQGSYIPKPIEETIKKGFGDCKDFSLLLVTMLRELGLKAHFALVRRGDKNALTMGFDNIPTMTHFNHAIVALDYKGKRFWLDPTNSQTFGLKHRIDIAEREALVLQKETTALSYIPESPLPNGKFFQTKTYTYKENNSAMVQGTLEMGGETVLGMMNVKKRLPPGQYQLVLEKLATGQDKSNYVEIDGGKIDPISYSDLNLAFKYKKKFKFNKEKGSPIAFFGTGMGDAISLIKENYVGNITLGEKKVSQSKIIVKDIKLVSKLPDGCNVSTENFDLNRNFSYKNNVFSASETFKIKDAFLKNTTIKDPSFKITKSDIYECLENRVVYVAHKTSSIKEYSKSNLKWLKLSAKERVKEAKKIIKEVGHKKTSEWSSEDAMEMVKDNLKSHPKDVESLIVLGELYFHSGYYSGSEYNKGKLQKSVSLFKRALKISPNNKVALIKMSNSYRNLKERELAKDALNQAKALGAEKMHAYWYSLTYLHKDNTQKAKAILKEYREKHWDKKKFPKEGLYCLEANRVAKNNDEEIKAFEKCLAVSPDYAWGWHNLSISYKGKKQYLKAKEASEKAQELMEFGAAKEVYKNLVGRMSLEALVVKDYETAEKYAIESIEVRDNYLARITLAKLAIKDEDFKRAEVELEKASRLSDSDKYVVSLSKCDLYHSSNKMSLLLREARKGKDLAKNGIQKLKFYKYLATAYKGLGKNKSDSRALFDEIKPYLEKIENKELSGHDLIYIGELYSTFGRMAQDLNILKKGVSFYKKAKDIGYRVDEMDDFLKKANKFVSRIEEDEAGRSPSSDEEEPMQVKKASLNYFDFISDEAKVGAAVILLGFLFLGRKKKPKAKKSLKKQTKKVKKKIKKKEIELNVSDKKKAS